MLSFNVDCVFKIVYQRVYVHSHGGVGGGAVRSFVGLSKKMIFGTQQLDQLWSWMKKFISPQSENRLPADIPPQRAKSLKAVKKRSEYTLFGNVTTPPKGRETFLLESIFFGIVPFFQSMFF